MRIWSYRELREKSTDELLDKLSTYLVLKKDITNISNIDTKSKKYYNEEFIINYKINIRKIKNELKLRTENIKKIS